MYSFFIKRFYFIIRRSLISYFPPAQTAQPAVSVSSPNSQHILQLQLFCKLWLSLTMTLAVFNLHATQMDNIESFGPYPRGLRVHYITQTFIPICIVVKSLQNKVYRATKINCTRKPVYQLQQSAPTIIIHKTTFSSRKCYTSLFPFV